MDNCSVRAVGRKSASAFRHETMQYSEAKMSDFTAPDPTYAWTGLTGSGPCQSGNTGSGQVKDYSTQASAFLLDLPGTGAKSRRNQGETSPCSRPQGVSRFFTLISSYGALRASANLQTIDGRGGAF